MHVNDLRSLIPNGASASQHDLLRAAIALGHKDDAAVFLRCEAPGCTVDVSFAEAHSVAAVYRRHPSASGASISFQCPTEQHFGCCYEHAVQALSVCLQQHIAPVHAQLEAERNGNA